MLSTDVTLDSLILADLQKALKAMKKDSSFNRKDFRKLRFLARNFPQACPRAKYWAATQVTLYTATQH